MKFFSKKRWMAGLLSVVLCSSVLTANAWAANVEETPGLQLQTILIDNDGKNWTTESWGGATMTPKHQLDNTEYARLLRTRYVALCGEKQRYGNDDVPDWLGFPSPQPDHQD